MSLRILLPWAIAIGILIPPISMGKDKLRPPPGVPTSLPAKITAEDRLSERQKPAPVAAPARRSLEQLAPPPPMPANGDEIFTRLRRVLFRVALSVSSEASKSAYGTGFAVGPKTIATNYHVISQAAVRPDQYRIFIHGLEAPVEARILDVDVVNDLALLEIDATLPTSLEVPNAPQPNVQKGEKLFSLGFPRDLGMSLVEGNFNGVLTDGAYYSLLTSSPLNSGMSGGPTVDRFGRLVGINKSILVEAQNISFLASPYYLHLMMSRQSERKIASLTPTPPWRNVVEDQLVALQDRLSQAFVESKETPLKMGPWALGRPPKNFRCWRDTSEGMGKMSIPFEMQTCTGMMRASPENEVEGGNIELNYFILKNSESGFSSKSELLGKFFRDVPQHFGTSFRDSTSNREHFTKHDCGERTVLNDSGIALKVSYCTTGFKKYERLNSSIVKVMSLNPNGSVALIVTSLYGFTPEATKKIIDHIVNGLARGAT